MRAQENADLRLICKAEHDQDRAETQQQPGQV